jgi:predicted RNA-binding Zn ribbon-like protein
VQFNTYGGSAARLAEELANLDPASADVAAVEAVLGGHRVARVALSAADIATLVDWGGRLRAVFTAGPVAAKVAMLNALLAEVAARPYISTHDDQPPHLHYDDGGGSLPQRVRAQTAAGLAVLLVDGGARRIGACAAPGCPTVFVDTSRAGRRTYCTPTCATRVNVAAHRVRSAHRAR